MMGGSENQESKVVKRKRKKSFFDMVMSKSKMSQETLEVWRKLPNEIRDDPSMINFQKEAEMCSGKQ
jgi:hypothetical protein